MTLLVKDANTDNTGAVDRSRQHRQPGAAACARRDRRRDGDAGQRYGAAARDQHGRRRRRCDGSGAVRPAGSAQTVFGGVTPVNGWLVANNSSATLYVSDVGAATPGGASIPDCPGRRVRHAFGIQARRSGQPLWRHHRPSLCGTSMVTTTDDGQIADRRVAARPQLAKLAFLNPETIAAVSACGPAPRPSMRRPSHPRRGAGW